MEKELIELLKLKENVVRANMSAELDERLGVDATKSNDVVLFYEEALKNKLKQIIEKYEIHIYNVKNAVDGGDFK